MDHLSLVLTILGSLLFLGFFVLYNKKILSGSIKPNVVSWGLFSLFTLINSTTYIFFTHDLFKGALAFTDCFTCLIITYLILFKGEYSKPTILEKIIIFLCIASLVVWYLLHSAVYANLLLQPAVVLAFIPTYRNVWKSPQNESALVWLMWASSFLFTITVIIIRFNGNWADFVNPILAGSLHAGVGLLALRKAKQA